MEQATKEANRVKKELHIVYSDNKVLPTFDFVGVWTGFDISSVSSNIRRAYSRVKRDQRRTESSETRSNSAKGAVE